MARTSSLFAGFVAGVVVAASTTAIAVTGTNTPTDPDSKATTTWLTVKVADAMGTRDTITWVPTGSFAGSAEERVPRYPMTAIQGKDTKELNLSAVRNEQVSAQLAIASGKDLDDVKAVVGDLTGPGGAKLSGDDTQVRFVKYVPVQRSKSEVDWSATIDQVSSSKEVSGDRNPDVVGDPLEERSSVDVPAYAAQPLWFTFHIPEKARPGTYRGTVKVEADGRTQARYPLTIEVADASAPDSDDYSFFLDVWAQPETIAQAHGVKLWSDKHWKLIEAYSRDLASRGQKVINTTIVDNPWHHQWSLGTRESQTATPYSSMVGWTWDGKAFSFDFARWDKYVRTARRAGLGPDIGAFSMLAFQDKEHLTYTDTRTGKTVYEHVDLGGDRWREAWGAFLPAFEEHLKAKGWLEDTWLSFDERPIDTMTVVKDFVHEVAPVFDDRISVAGSISTEGVASNLSVDWGGIDAMTKEKVAERRAAGKLTTFYVYGSPAHPNTLSYSPAVESRMLPWISAQRNLDGFLRWSYNSWTRDPFHQPVHIFTQGDEYLVYPGKDGPMSSIRWEQLKEGIEDYELIAQLRKKEAGAADSDALTEALATATRNLDGRTKDVSDIETARAAVVKGLTS
ncbi:glycoside hydrolase domain-containing protein [Streptomyces sp. NPDC000941]